jgi:aminopeptidase N
VEDSIWHIPITYASKVTNSSFNENKPRFWLQQKETEITLNELRSDSYFLVNVQQVGYYRVQYDDSNWELIAKELSEGNFSMISANSRAMLIDDASVFFEMKILKLRILLEIIKYLEHDVSKKRFLFSSKAWYGAMANIHIHSHLYL